ncbi:MAG: alpha-1,2-fucosyltransferase [Flavobacteriaceae bacterium]|nr:alpha-1,2-fucosyltransferase [Flavobacteriaceae bacterium]|tara:strand:- start:123153 stop:123956 length:804 start_codon:yes stop_codon:yes gene_type:complete
MVTVRILGGLGNQMFQYAYAKSLQQLGYAVQLDLSAIKKYTLHGGYQLDKFQIDLTEASNSGVLLAKLNVYNTFKERNLLFHESFLKLPKRGYVKGYFQTEKYFHQIRPDLLTQFQLKQSFSEKAEFYKKAIAEAKSSCSIHIRRGDYVSNKSAQEIHGSCSLEYYQRAISRILETSKNTEFFIFSDDLDWVKSNLEVPKPTYVDIQGIPHEDMLLMSQCDHNITANSSFSWWGAWLNTNPEKMVISPKQWYVSKENEIVPETWIKL